MSAQLTREILTLSVPAVIATITTPLLGLMDTAFTGHMGGAVYLGAIAVGGNVFNLVYWLFGFLRMGTGGLTAQACGKNDRDEWSLALWRGLILAIAIGLAIILLQNPLFCLMGRFLSPEPDVWAKALDYMHIVVWGAPAVMMSYTLTGWFIGMQSTRSAMVMSIVIDVVNLVVSLWLVVGMKMKVEGVATGTLAAQWTGVIVAVFLVGHYHPRLSFRLRQIFDFQSIRHFFIINTDIFLRTLCMIAVTLWFTRAGAMQGTVILGVNAMLMQFFLFFSYFIDGSAYAAEALTGKAVGGGDVSRVREVSRGVMRFGAVLALIFTSLYFLLGETAVGLLSDDKNIVNAAKDYLPWVIAIPLTSFAAFTWDGICVGATATRQMLLSMALATAVYFALYFSLQPILGNHGLWIAFLAYLLLRSLILPLIARRHLLPAKR